MAPDGRTLALLSTDFTWHYGSIGGPDIQPLAVLTATDQLLGWAADSRAIYVHGTPSGVARIDRVEIGSGTRKRVREVGMSEPGVISLQLTDYRLDGAYAYWYWKQPSTILEVLGLDVR